MAEYVLSFKPAVGPYGMHDPSAVIFEDGRLVYGVEEERFTRDKHAVATFPEQSIRACLDFCDIQLNDVSAVRLPYDPRLQSKNITSDLRRRFARGSSLPDTLQLLERFVEQHIGARFMPKNEVEQRLRAIGTPVPPIDLYRHHACHAASAFHPSGFDEALVVTIDGKGEYDATVIWHGNGSGLRHERTYQFPNSLGHFYGIITEFLGYRSFNGEGKVMGLAPYGGTNPDIESILRETVETGVNYDVTPITGRGIPEGVNVLEDLFDRGRNRTRGRFDEWEADLAYTAQTLLEEIVTDIVEHYCEQLGVGNVCLAGGVALNCKMNRRVMEHESVDAVSIQPVAHDAGLAIGAGYLGRSPHDVTEQTDVYWGPEYSRDEIQAMLEANKVAYREPGDLELEVAQKLADGELIGWFQGALEMGPRALGDRSILADPRTVESRDRVNRYVKHREEWRPFAPSMLEDAAETYLVNGEPSPYMIKTFAVKPDRRDEIEAVLHPADDTTRPQTVNEDQNPRYHRLISAFEDITGVPVLLNTSFNDHGEPIVNTPKEALKDFYGMGLDTLVLEDYVVEK